MIRLRATAIAKTFTHPRHEALRNLDLEVGTDEVLALVGESGSGKTTAARIIAGLEMADEGTIELDGRLIAGPSTFVPPERRAIGMVFQNAAIFPHLSVRGNILFGIPRSERRDARAIEERLSRLLAMTHLTGLADRYPHQLSGGQVQRVAIARSLAPMPRLLILDEPFNNLDASLKTGVVREVTAILRESGVPAILVTHSPWEAFTVADRLAVIRNGSIVQSGTPEEVYRRPRDRGVAGFFGPVNEIPVRRTSAGYESPVGAVHGDLVREEGSRLAALLRPHDLILTGADDGNGDGGGNARVVANRYYGEYRELDVAVDGTDTVLAVRAPETADYATGDRVRVSPCPNLQGRVEPWLRTAAREV
ncbi:MAG: ATP-binding cassette domain-containing protein [Spirochaetes bacterium]|jgi:iron(III) transport system ATP-binding protein|nr:ATP-binding cassette domain-containing protein [Spirochaetota bacterium]